jgi:hypothetical protein
VREASSLRRALVSSHNRVGRIVVVGVPADLGLATTGHPGAASQKPDRTSQIKLRIVRTGSVLH